MATPSAPVNRQINIYINQEAAQRSMDQLNLKADKLSKTIKKGEAAGLDMSKQIEKLGQTKSKIAELEGVISGKFAPSLNMARKRAADLKKELDNMSSSAPGYAAKLKEFEKASETLKKLKTEANATGVALEKSFGKNQSFWSQVKGIAAGTLIGGFLMEMPAAIYGALNGMIQGNAKLSDSLADVKKATGLTVEEVKALNSELSKIDTRTKSAELREIAIGLGQIGEAANKENIENIDKIVVALGDEFGGGAREITTTLGILRNNLSDIKSGNYGEDVLHIANALNLLGAEGLATAPVVVEFASRMSGVMQTFGVSSGQILGLSASMQELGIESERGSTAMVKLLQKMAAETDKFGKIITASGGNLKDFQKLINTDIIAAFQLFAEAAKKAGSTNASFAAILKEVDADGSGAGEVLSKLAQNAELVNSKVTLSTNALKESSSITEEFNTKNNNLAATLEKISKKMSAAFTNSTITSGLTGLVNKFGEWVGAIDASEVALKRLTEQSGNLSKMEEAIPPLLAQYEELKNKTQLSAEEQEALRGIIQRITEIMPEAANAFDEYGRAIDISTGAAKEHLRLQRLMLAEDYENEIENTEEKVFETRARLGEEKAKLYRMVLRADMWRKKGEDHMYAQSNLVIAETRKNIDDLQNAIDAAYARLNKLKGLPLTGEANNGGTMEIPLPHGVSLTDYKALGNKTKPTNTPSPSPTLENKSGRSPEKDLEKLRDKVLQVNREIAAAEQGENQASIQRAQEKYLALSREINAFAKKFPQQVKEMLSQLTEAEQTEIGALMNKQNTERIEKAYEQQLAALQAHLAEERRLLDQQYAERKITRKQYDEAIAYSDREGLEARKKLAENYSKLIPKAEKDMQDAMTREAEKGASDRLKADTSAKTNIETRLRTNVLTARKGSRAELNARLDEIKYHYDQERELAEGNAEALKDIDKREHQEVSKTRSDFFKGKLEQYLAVGQAIVGVIGDYVAYANQREQEMLDAEKERNEERKKGWKEMLDNKRITQAQYDKNVAKADEELRKKEHEAKVRQFNRTKAANIGTATMNLALAISGVWAQWAEVPWVAAALTALAAAAAGIQIANIVRQKPPTYAYGRRPEGAGGVPAGPSHSNGGINLVDGQTGEVVGQMEGDEPILSKDTYSNNKELVEALLDSSMYNSGKRIQWYNSMPSPINYQRASAALQSSYRTGRTATSTTEVNYNNTGGGSSSNDYALMMGMMEKFMQKMDVPFKSYVVYKDVREKQEEYDSLKKAGSYSG